MRSVSHPGTHHRVFQLNLRSHVCVPKFFYVLQGLRNVIKLRKPGNSAPSKSPPVGETLASIALSFLKTPYREGLGGAKKLG